MNATMATNVTAKDAVQKVISEIITWGKRLAALALLAFIILTLGKLFGVFVAGTGYALTR